MPTLFVNGEPEAVDAKHGALVSLLQPKGVPYPCRDERCGGCLVLLNGIATKSCSVPVSALVDGDKVETSVAFEHEAHAREAVERFRTDRSTRCARCIPPLVVLAELKRRASARSSAHQSMDDAVRLVQCACTGRSSLERALGPE